jgi:putative ABC transport system permease protein
MVKSAIAVWHRLRAIVLRRRLDRDLDDEIAFHLDMRAAEYRSDGASAGDARLAARRDFGNVASLKEHTRDMWTFPSFESIRQDVRYAVRTLRRAPGFTTVALLALTLGIAGNTAMFSLVDAVRIRALPYAQPEQLVVLWGNVMRTTLERRGASYPDFLDWRAQSHSLEGLAAQDETMMTLSGVGDAKRIHVETVSAAYFPLLRMTAAAGRTFTPDEDAVPQKTPVAVLSDGFWRREFGGDPSVVGRTISLDARSFTITGVMPAGFRGLSDRADAWIPFVMSDSAEALTERGNRGFQVLARLRPGVTMAAAQAELDTICRRLEQAYPDTNEKRGVELSPLDVELVGNFRPALRLLMAAVAFVLLIACANVANLLLARSEARQREIAVRTAIGAGWSRLLRQMLTESVVLTAIAAAAGLALAEFALIALVRIAPISFPSFVQPHVNMRVATFTIAVCAGCAILLGLAPAVHGRISRLPEALKDSARGSTGRRSQRLRRTLIVMEVALAVVLLVGAGLMIRTVQHLSAIDPGFNPSDVLSARVSIPRLGAPEGDTPAPLAVSARVLLERVRALPGVTAASLVSDPPLSGIASAVFYTAEGQPVMNAQQRPRAYVHRATPDFFATLQIPLKSGRAFVEQDQRPDATVVVVSENVAGRFWPGQSAIGKRIKIGGLNSPNPWLSIVGVVGEVKYRGLPENPTGDPDLYFPFLDRSQQVSLVIRSGVDASSLVTPFRQVIREINPNIPVFAVTTMRDAVDDQTAQSRFTTWLMGAFAGVALLLASVGIYGVMSYLVLQRTREVGIRMALGATRHEIVRLVVGGGARLIVLGVVLGGVAALALARVSASLFYGVTVRDAATLVAVAVLVTVGLAACYLPAVRAARIDPLTALRVD